MMTYIVRIKVNDKVGQTLEQLERECIEQNLFDDIEVIKVYED